MTKNPTAEQVEDNPELQAFQAIIEEDSTPTSRAEYSKNHGNAQFERAKKQKNRHTLLF